MKNKKGKINKKLIGILICTIFIISGISTAQTFVNNPPNIPSNPHPIDGAIDIGLNLSETLKKFVGALNDSER